MWNERSVVDVLAKRQRNTSAANAREAGVLVGIIATEDEPRVLLTRRSELLSTHRGQISLPGGRRDATDEDLVATALREAEEEVGLSRRSVRVLGLLDELVTISNYKMTPVLAVLEGPLSLRPNPTEVAEVLLIPLRVFLVESRARLLPGEGLRRAVLSYEHDGHVVWGATASVLSNLAEVILSATA
ncbi:MAG: CoA pyrophosphatase [Deltaproteobacteria bacterium]|nr:CoA pyrophosphatase [Deltaproteobacteria bacterium]